MTTVELETNDITQSIEKKKLTPEKIDRVIYSLLIIFIATMPLIVFGRFEYVTSPLITHEGLLDSGYKVEMFSHYKFFWTLMITAICFMLLIIKFFIVKTAIKPRILHVWISIFSGALLASTIFSPSIHIAMYGLYNRSDGAISWLCYALLLFIALQIQLHKNVLNHVLIALLPFTSLNLFIFTMNFYGHDLLTFSFFKQALMMNLPKLFDINDSAQILGTLDQWNYLSGMFAMVTVLYLSWALTTQNKKFMIMGSIAAAMATLIVFLSISTSGFLTLIVCTPILLLIVFQTKQWKQTAIVGAIYLIICTTFFIVWNEKQPRMYQESFGTVINLILPSDDETLVNEPILQDGYLPILPEPSISGGSGRIYIWQKTWDLIKERPVVGYGMDTLAYNFPHNNIDARAGIRTENVIVDKPHNVFLGVFYGTGIVGFTCFVLLALYTTFILIRSIFEKQWVVTTFSFFSFAYFIQGIFNDSLVAMTALAFLMIGLSVNQLQAYKQKTQ